MSETNEGKTIDLSMAESLTAEIARIYPDLRSESGALDAETVASSLSALPEPYSYRDMETFGFYHHWRMAFHKLGVTGLVVPPHLDFNEWLEYFHQWAVAFADDYLAFQKAVDAALADLDGDLNALDDSFIDTNTVDVTTTGTIDARNFRVSNQVKISSYAPASEANAITARADGLYAPDYAPSLASEAAALSSAAGAINSVATDLADTDGDLKALSGAFVDTNTVNATTSGSIENRTFEVKNDVIISGNAGNLIEATSSGLYAENYFANFNGGKVDATKIIAETDMPPGASRDLGDLSDYNTIRIVYGGNGQTNVQTVDIPNGNFDQRLTVANVTDDWSVEASGALNQGRVILNGTVFTNSGTASDSQRLLLSAGPSGITGHTGGSADGIIIRRIIGVKSITIGF